MGLAVDLVLAVVFTLSISFSILQVKGLLAAAKVKPYPRPTKREIVLGLGIAFGIYSVLGMIFYVGWLGNGFSGGVIATITALVGAALVLLALAVKAAWVKRS
ncbi:MAG: hypothetical protein JWQ32_1457 [Marmoricola sp.]|nr:hypothetical protein [Marmoricola sp.]